MSRPQREQLPDSPSSGPTLVPAQRGWKELFAQPLDMHSGKLGAGWVFLFLSSCSRLAIFFRSGRDARELERKGGGDDEEEEGLLNNNKVILLA